MKPKLKQSVHYAPTEDGVYFKTWTSEFAIKGRGLYEWIERIAPYLDGQKTVDELVEPLSREQAQFVRNLIDELVRRGAVHDVVEEDQGDLTDREQKLYQQTILYLEEYAPHGRRQFHQFRQKSWILSGSGLSYRACVRSLVTLGGKTLYLETTEDSVLLHFIEEWQEKDPELQVEWIAKGEEKDLLGKVDPSLQLAFYVSDQYEAERVDSLINLYKRCRIDFIIASAIENRGLVGPILNQASPFSWHSLMDRLHPQEEETTVSPTFYLMQGNIAALEAFKYANQLSAEDKADDVVILTPELLETKRHILKPSPFFSADGAISKEEWLVRFQEQTVEQDQEEFLEQVRELSDPQLGILHPVHPGDLWQIPLMFMGATLHFPRSIKRESVFFVSGKESVSDATEQVVRNALTYYAQGIHESEGGSELGATASVWENGRTFAEWVGRGVLAVWSEMKKGSARATELPARIPSLKCASYAKMLSLRYGCAVRLIEVELGLPSSHYVMVLDGKRVLADGVGRTQNEAVEKALVQAISHMQLENHHPDLLSKKDKRWDPRTSDAEGKWQSEQPLPTWQEWHSLVEPHWKEQGWELIIDPWYRDPACFEAGLLIGRIGLKQGGGI